jgi:hypothetical protein
MAFLDPSIYQFPGIEMPAMFVLYDDGVPAGSSAAVAADITAHADLFDAAYWRGVQERLKSGAVMHIFPYRESLRLQGDGRL